MKPEQQFVYTRTYSRYLEEEKRRESYPETVDRYINYMADKLDISKYFADMGREATLAMDVMPSMRAMWAAGPAADNCNVCIYNCSYAVIDCIRSFSEVLYVLMSGTGAGFSIESSNVNKLPSVHKVTNTNGPAIVVEDSKEGWASALDKFLVAAITQGIYHSVDVSKVRPKGARLKTMGGRSSGPEPFVDLINFCKIKIQSVAGNRLRPIDCLDILNKIADIVVVGGVRRSSEISLSDIGDKDVANAKSGLFWIDNPQRAMSNNSVAYANKPTFNEFLDEFSNLIKSGTGERGIFNRQAAKDWANYTGRRNPNYEFGTNPCQPAWATVLTPGGISTIGDIKIGDVIWSGQRWTRVINKVSTGTKLVNEYRTTAGSFFGTSKHRVVCYGQKIEAESATHIDVASPRNDHVNFTSELCNQSVIDGLVIGDGSAVGKSKVVLCVGQNDLDYFTGPLSSYIEHKPYDRNFHNVTTTVKVEELPKLPCRTIPDRFYKGNLLIMRSFLRGLYSANGSVVGNGAIRVTLKTASFKLMKQVQEMLSALGIISYYTTNKATTVKFKNGDYVCKQSYDLNITHDRSKFYNLIGFEQPYKMSKIESYILKPRSPLARNKARVTFPVVETIPVSEEKVFDITVDAPEHTYWTGGLLVSNCSEILMRPNEFCNLSEVVARAGDSLEVLKNKVKIATMYGAWQATCTDFKYLSKQWRVNAEEERLLGVSVTGIMDHKVLGSCTPKANKWWNELRNVSISEAEKWSKRLGINMPAAITCVKPSGTVSQLVDSASGIHARFANYYIRRYRISTTDPLFNMLVAQGIPWSPENGQFKESCSTAVLSYPVKAPAGAITRHDLTALQQLEHWQMVKHCWTEHNPSVTIYVEPDEWFKVADWVWTNFDTIGGLSFLPKTDHIYQQAPYEEVDEAKYKELVAAMPKIDYSQLSKYEQEDNTEGSRSYACVGDKCELS